MQSSVIRIEVNDMTNNFPWNLGEDYICHYGKGHDDNPPGRGSGRYGWGTGTKNHKPRPKTLKSYIDNYVAERTKQFKNQYGYVPTDKFEEYKAESDRLIEECKQTEGYHQMEAHVKAKELYAEAEQHVDKITSDVSFFADSSRMQMFGLENKQKSIHSLERKIDKKMSEDGMTADEAAASIKDAVRFTTISPTKDFVDNYEWFKGLAEVSGYNESRCKNYFEAYNRGEVKHKSVQCNYKTPDGYEFEIQFHTPESQDVKTRKIPLYEEVRKKDIKPERAKQIEAQMAKMAEEIPNPVGIAKIKDHK